MEMARRRGRVAERGASHSIYTSFLLSFNYIQGHQRGHMLDVRRQRQSFVARRRVRRFCITLAFYKFNRVNPEWGRVILYPKFDKSRYGKEKPDLYFI